MPQPAVLTTTLELLENVDPCDHARQGLWKVRERLEVAVVIEELPDIREFVSEYDRSRGAGP